jgi:predicted nuclease of predicted toxin-antitoxin system
VKLLFDHNLSPRLVRLLADLYPGSRHVRDLGLQEVADEIIWEYAAAHGFAITSKDADFHQHSFLYGPPPKVIWIQRGNCPTTAIVELLRVHARVVEEFLSNPEAAFLAIR